MLKKNAMLVAPCGAGDCHSPINPWLGGSVISSFTEEDAGPWGRVPRDLHTAGDSGRMQLAVTPSAIAGRR